MGWLLLAAANFLLCLIGLGDRTDRAASPAHDEAAMVILGGAFCLAMVMPAGWLPSR